MRIRNKIVIMGALTAGFAISCGGRGGLELGDYLYLDSGAGGTHAILDGGSDTSADVAADAPADSSLDHVVKDVVSDQKDLFDIIPPLPDGSLIGICVNCLNANCGDSINACYNDPNCISGLQCSITSCISLDGGLDTACMEKCFTQTSSLISAALALQCIQQNCWDVCGGGILGDSGIL